MEDTGERYLPLLGGPDVRIAYEHWHRYLYASQFVTGKEVLDIASGEGYGSDLLAGTAKHVVGVDADPEVVRHAGSKYLRPNVEFRCGSAEAIPCEGRHLFDVVVSFETIEHLWEEQQEKLLHEIRRVLRPEGVLFVSTPNKLFYSDRPGYHNPFHRREFYCHEYLGLLRRFFPSVHLLGQKVYGGSYLWQLGGPPRPLSEFQLAYADGQFGPASGEKKEALYLLAVCSGGPLEPPAGSLLIDVSEQAVWRSLEGPAEREGEAPALSEAVAPNEEALPVPSENNNEVLGAIGQLRDALQAHVAADAERARGENDGLRREAEELRRHAQALAAENEAKDREAAGLQGRLQGLTQEVEAAHGAAEELRQAVAEREARARALAKQVEEMTAQGRELRELLLDAHDQLQRRDEEIQATLAAALQEREAAWRQAVSPRSAGESAPPAAAPHSNGPVVTGPIAAVKARGATTYLGYQLLIRKVREAVEGAVPAGATVVVVSKGDGELLRLEGRRGWHFPQRPDGIYSGHHPADGAAAVAHLEELRARGADYLLIPQTSLWWLDHYADFRRHLEGRYREALRQPDVCVIYSLRSGPEMNGGPLKPATQTAAAVQRPFGVNVAGYLASEKAVGEGVRADVRGLRAARIPYVLNNVVDPESLNEEATYTDISEDQRYAINLIHVNAAEMPLFLAQRGEDYLRGRYNIGYWAWELSDFPEEWRASFQYFDEIWAPSNFVLGSLARVSPVPVVRIPHSLRGEFAAQPCDRSYFGLPTRAFIFLFVFDFHSYMERKNPLGLIRAFLKAFGKRGDVLLVLKCSHSSPAEMLALKEAAAGANVRILDTVLTREELTRLMSLCDCYVSLHRSEGFGLTMAEAMSLGKPVIATGYSGNVDFMNTMNSYLVNYRLTEIEKDHGPYPKGWVWADPDLDHAAALMRFVRRNRDRAREMGARARRDVLQDLHPGTMGALIKERLLSLAAFGKVPPPDERLGFSRRGGSVGKELQYQRLVGDIRTVAGVTLPPDASVLVISRGDPALLKLGGGRRGWHFPQCERGVYAGHNPADSVEAVAHLETLRAKGAEFLLIPRTALWWLGHYAGLREHLDDRYRRLPTDDSCVIYDLAAPAPGLLGRAWRALRPGGPSREAPGYREIRMPLAPAEVNNLTCKGNVVEGTGDDPYLVLALERPQWVAAIRLTFSYRSGSPPLYLQLYWQRSDRNVFANDERNVRLEQQPGAGERTELVVVNDVIDRIRLDPDDHPCVLQVGEVTLLVAASDPDGPKAADKAADYQQLVRRARRAICAAVPAGATVLVVSKGDEELLRLEGRTAWHFPRTDGGAYAGHHPADSAAAIGQLEVLRGRGAGYLVFPKTALWWLDHYSELKQHLEGRYRRVHSDDSCVIYQLTGTGPGLWRRLLHPLSPSG
jgi:glycosyltransferase involved in cell wall biosynthesis/SAM-dependent methyltransferase